MKGLAGALSANNLSLVREAAKLRFQDAARFKTPEALIIYEQNLMDDAALLQLCSSEYGIPLQAPTPQYISKELVNEYRGLDCVPIRYDASTHTMYVGVLPEMARFIPDVRGMNTVQIKVPVYYYVQLYTRHFGRPSFLYELPATDKLNFILEEAISLNAADITISCVAEGARVYYNVRKRKVKSKRAILREDVEKFAELLASRAGAPISTRDVTPRYFSVTLDLHHRGRVALNRNYYGRAITIRVLSDDILAASLEELNIAPSACDFIRQRMLSGEKGLRLFIGEPMSGKNTTILSALMELVAEDRYKIVSIENPVETLVAGVEQINVESEEEFALNAASLLRQNPDVVYIAEITDFTAHATVQAANIGKVVFSSVHANSISDVLSRLMDITGMSSDRLLLSMHSCCYQELVRDDRTDTVRPVNRCLYFSDELKMRLYGKSLGECKMILQEEEAKWQ